MKKNILLLLVIMMVFLSTSIQTTYADIGPKPVVEVTIVGVDEEYSFDLLIKKSSELVNINTEPWSYYKDDYPEALHEYQDSDGFVSYSLYDVPATVYLKATSDEGTVFLMNYLSPSSFKIVIVTEDNDAIITSKYVETARFESAFVWDLTGVDLDSDLTDAGILTGDIEGENLISHSWFVTGLNTLIRVLLTMFIELGILFLFGFRKKSTFIKVGIVNAMTQIVLSIFLISSYLNNGMMNYIFWTIIGEFIVFLVELSAYFFIVDEHKRLRIFLYTLTANIITIIVGIFLISII